MPQIYCYTENNHLQKSINSKVEKFFEAHFKSNLKTNIIRRVNFVSERSGILNWDFFFTVIYRFDFAWCFLTSFSCISASHSRTKFNSTAPIGRLFQSVMLRNPRNTKGTWKVSLSITSRRVIISFS